HFHDVEQLLHVLMRLRDEGNTVVVIEHNLDVIKTADWVIDLGPEGGEGGGRVVATGTPEDIAATEASWTGRYLRPLLGRQDRARHDRTGGERRVGRCRPLAPRAAAPRVRLRERRAGGNPRRGAPRARSVRGARRSHDARAAPARGTEYLDRAAAMSSPAAAALAAQQLSLSLVGVPNCGKTALFNRLTGSRQKVANYPGVTVERKEGRLTGPRAGRLFRVVDLPGAYSLEPATLDEAIARDVVLGRHATEPAPDLLVCVVDATNLRLSLRLVLELK